MSKKAPCLKVPKAGGQETLEAAGKLNLVNKTLVIQKKGDLLCIPLIKEPKKEEMEILRRQLPEFQLAKDSFFEKKPRKETLPEILDGTLPPHLLGCLPKALDLVGDIAIVGIPPELDAHKNAIGKALLRTHKNIRVVLAKAGVVGGTFRLREFEHLAGERRTSTLYRENGCSYYLDVAKAYFSPRLSHEHERVAALVRDGEEVVDLFAGVGPFTIPIAKNHRNVKVFAIDLNSDAIELLERNIRLNRVNSKVYPIVGDARRIIYNRLAQVADRVIMNLPESASEFVDAACRAIKPTGGLVHFYCFMRSPDTLDDVQKRFAEIVDRNGRKVISFEFAKPVRETAPYEWQVALDARIR